MNNKGADQTAQMRRLICTFVVRILQDKFLLDLVHFIMLLRSSMNLSLYCDSRLYCQIWAFSVLLTSTLLQIDITYLWKLEFTMHDVFSLYVCKCLQRIKYLTTIKLANINKTNIIILHKSRLMTMLGAQNDCATSKDSDQPGHPPSLIRFFAVHMKKARVLSYPLNPQRRLIGLGQCPG